MNRVCRNFPLLAPHVVNIQPNERSRKDGNWHRAEVETVCPLCPNPQPQWKDLKKPLSPLCRRHHFMWLNYCRLRRKITWSGFIKYVQQRGEEDVRQNGYKVMKPHDSKLKAKVLELLQNGRGPQYASKLTSIPISTIESWSGEWRKERLLTAYVRPGMAYSLKGKLAFNGFHTAIRKAYRSMVDNDRASGRTCGFANVLECGPYLLDGGTPRACAYCGRRPPKGRIWGLDRLDSSLGHVPGNLVPCCGSHPDGRYLSCQASKSHYPLKAWLHSNMSRSLGRPASDLEVTARIDKIKRLAQSLGKRD